LARSLRIIGTDRSSPTIGIPASASGNAVRPVPTPMSRHGPSSGQFADQKLQDPVPPVADSALVWS
jgi:hypothetical protein